MLAVCPQTGMDLGQFEQCLCLGPTLRESDSSDLGRTWGSGGLRSPRARFGALPFFCWPVTLSFLPCHVTHLGGHVSGREFWETSLAGRSLKERRGEMGER